MHLEIQVALNFVISYLYNKLPRRRVNIFGEELEKALKDKFQGHWYPDKPVKGSAFRCLKTGDPIDSVLERAARESGVPISDILENLPSELSVWVDPGEVSYRIGEKSAVKILYSENSDNQEDSNSADREVNKTFNPEAQCFRPIDAVNTSVNNLSLSPKTSPLTGSSPLSATSNSPTYKGSPNTVSAVLNGSSFMQRTQAPLTFTTATFAQTKFGSTKLKTSSKRANSSSYRMSPTEFSNYIKQRAMQQQQMHHGPGTATVPTNGPPVQQSNHFGPIGPVSPARSISPNPLSLGMSQNSGNDPFYFPSMTMGMYPQFNGHHRNIFDTHGFHTETGNNCNLYGGPLSNGGAGGSGGNSGGNGHSKFSNFLEPHGFFGLTQHLQTPSQQQQQQQQQHTSPLPNGIIGGKNCHVNDVITTNGGGGNNSATSTKDITINGTTNVVNNNNTANITVTVTSGDSSVTSMNDRQTVGSGNSNSNSTESNINSTATSTNSKLIDSINSFYSNATGSYQQLLVAN